jgi:ribonuclease Z
VTEFDWQDDGGVIYERNGSTVRHWRRIHNMCGSSAYRLDWNGLSFVWTGDGRPDEPTLEMSQGVDVFVTELQLDAQPLSAVKAGTPEPIINMTIDGVHTNQFAAGYMFKRVEPRIGMLTHTFYDRATLTEAQAGVRMFWDGLLAYGAPDGVIVNVTKDAIWVRDAALPDPRPPGDRPPPLNSGNCSAAPSPKQSRCPKANTNSTNWSTRPPGLTRSTRAPSPHQGCSAT